MKTKKFPEMRFVYFVTLAFLLLTTNPAVANPKRDHLTRQEADMVRDTQELDKRIGVLVKAVDRRLLAIANPGAPTPPQSDIELVGELKGTRPDFLFDISKILDEAITNIDDVSGRDSRNPLIPKAIRQLAAVSSRVISQLAPLRSRIEGGPERSSLEEAMENAESIVEAAGKLAPPAKNSKKKEAGT